MKKEHNQSIASVLVQSMISIVICCACLIGSTFAWFTSRSMASVQSVGASELKFDVAVLEKESGTLVNAENEDLQAGNAYIVSLSLKYTSTAKKGYCAMVLEAADGTTIYYTPLFGKGVLESKSFELVVGKECKISVIPSWGTHSNETCGDKINYFAYSISYDLDGGVVESQNPTIYIVGNDEVILNNPTKDGYEFVGWTGSNGDVPQMSVAIEPNSVGDKIYNANWLIATPYVIAYNLSGGSFDESTPTTYYTNSETFELPQPTKEGFRFVGWAGSNGEEPQKDVVIEKGSIGNKEYEAVWEALTQYTITYELNDGVFVTIAPSVYYENSESFNLPIPVREGYRFVGWTGSNGEESQEIVTIEQNSSGNRVYNAVWEALPQYLITYDLNEGLFNESATTVYYENSPNFSLPWPIKDGFDFIGWTGSNGEIPEKDVMISIGNSGDKHYIANWSEQPVAEPVVMEDNEEAMDEVDPIDDNVHDDIMLDNDNE